MSKEETKTGRCSKSKMFYNETKKNELKQRKEEGEGLGKTKKTNVVRRCVKTGNEKKWKSGRNIRALL